MEIPRPVLARMVRFLDSLSTGHSYIDSLLAGGLTHERVNAYKARYPVFQADVARVMELREELREHERNDAMHQRAVYGVLEPFYAPGHGVKCYPKPSDTLLAKAVAAKHPGEYGDKVDVTHNQAPQRFLADDVPAPEWDESLGPLQGAKPAPGAKP